MGTLTHLAQGLIFSAKPLLRQKPAPPVANQKLTGLCNLEKMDLEPSAISSLFSDLMRITIAAVVSTHHLTVTKSFGGLDGPVQAGFANVDVMSVRVVGEQLHQGPRVHVVVVVHVTEPSE